jgi:hypothetical protein
MNIDMEMIAKRVAETDALGEDLCTRLRTEARETYAKHSDNDVEIDDDAQCLQSGDNAYWVEAWVYVRRK